MIHAKENLRRRLEPDIAKALLLVRDFRIKVLAQDINPLAARIAIIFMEKSDEYFAKTKITPETEILLEEIALDFHDQAKEGWQKSAGGGL